MKEYEEAKEAIADILYKIVGGDSEFEKEGGYHPMADFCDEEANQILNLKGKNWRIAIINTGGYNHTLTEVRQVIWQAGE
ncbi:MAG: hypothetical protein KAS32_21100 [Candidatus Peribacteraceae bacterium]|nr:hypothetical protein [Candidatus Peribacteraceae bacterium]